MNVSNRVLDNIAPHCIRWRRRRLLMSTKKACSHQMLGASIDCPFSLLTMELVIQRLLKTLSRNHRDRCVTDVSLADLYIDSDTAEERFSQQQVADSISAPWR